MTRGRWFEKVLFLRDVICERPLTRCQLNKNNILNFFIFHEGRRDSCKNIRENHVDLRISNAISMAFLGVNVL